MLKRLVFAMACVYLEDHASLQFVIYALSTMFMIIYLALVQPFQEWVDYKVTVFNEVVSMVVFYHILVFSEWVRDSEVKYMFGWSMIVVQILSMAYHVIPMIWQSLIDYKRLIKQYNAKYRAWQEARAKKEAKRKKAEAK